MYHHRETKRVPLSFSAPLNVAWSGYLMPEELQLPECPDCIYPDTGPWSTGYNHKTALLDHSFQSKWRRHLKQDEVQALIDHDRLQELTSVWMNNEWVKLTSFGIPSAEEVNLMEAKYGVGIFDTIDQKILVETRAKRIGVWGVCPTCHGNRTPVSEAQIAAHEAWQPTEPPKGRGWQMWETFTTGSPISPVFRTAKMLADWCATNATVFLDTTATSEQWLIKILRDEEAAREARSENR